MSKRAVHVFFAGALIIALTSCGRHSSDAGEKNEDATNVAAATATSQLSADPAGNLDASGAELRSFGKIDAPTGRSKNPNCNVDSVALESGSDLSHIGLQSKPVISGWVSNPSFASVPSSFRLYLVGQTNSYALEAHTATLARPDVAKASGHEVNRDSGFRIRATVSSVAPGSYGLEIAGQDGGVDWVCTTHKKLTFE